MATNNRGVDYADVWAWYKKQDEFGDKQAKDFQAQILHLMNLSRNLPILSWKAQIEILENAPMDIIKAHAKLLHEKTKKHFGLEEKRVNLKGWAYNSFL